MALVCFVFVSYSVTLTRLPLLSLLVVGAIRSEPPGQLPLRIFGFSHLRKQREVHVCTQTEMQRGKGGKHKGAAEHCVQALEVSLFQCCFFVLVWQVSCEGLLVHCETKQKKSHWALWSQERRWRREGVFCSCLVAHAYQSSATLIKLSCLCCKSLWDSNQRRLLTLRLQAKTPSELDYISLAFSWDVNKFWFAFTVVRHAGSYCKSSLRLLLESDTLQGNVLKCWT